MHFQRQVFRYSKVKLGWNYKAKQADFFNDSGTREWIGEEYLGESLNNIILKSKTRTEFRDKHTYINQRVLVADVDNNGVDEAIVVKQTAAKSGRLLERFRYYSSGVIIGMEWNGIGFEKKWSTKKISGYISDYNIFDFNGNGKKDLVISVVVKEGFSTKTESTIVYYPLGI